MHETQEAADSSVEPLSRVAVAARDEEWEQRFLKQLATSTLTISHQEPITGPDGWPYLAVSTGGEEPVRAVVNWLATRGVGLVVNADKPMPDFVLSYGMVWNFRERGEFIAGTVTKASAPPRAGALNIENGQQLFTGVPSASYLPTDVRAVILDFLKQQRVLAPKVLMLSTDQNTWDLAFSIESLGSPPRAEHAGIAEALSWFLPAHYSVALISETTVPGFTAL